MSHSKLTSKGQTTIPAEVREALELQPGDRIVFEIRGNRATIRRHPGVSAVAGALAGKFRRPPAAPGREKAAARRAWAEQAAR